MSRRAALAGAALSLLALAVVRGSGGGPPLYDGVCTAPSYLRLGANPPPPSFNETVSASEVTSTFEKADNDNTPQAQIIAAAGAIAPSGPTATITITPIRPPAVQPTDGTIDGNVYDFEITSGGQKLSVVPGHLVTIVLGTTSTGGPQLAVEHFDGTRWKAPAASVQSGCGTTYQANSTTLGIFALVSQGQAIPGPGTSGGGGGATIVVIVVVVLVVLALVIGAMRMNRRGRRRGTRRR